MVTEWRTDNPTSLKTDYDDRVVRAAADLIELNAGRVAIMLAVPAPFI